MTETPKKPRRIRPPAPPPTPQRPARKPAGETAPAPGGARRKPEPTRYGDWEKNGRCIDF